MNKEIAKEILDYWIIVLQINNVVELKMLAVKDQDFLKAGEYRDEEKKLRAALPTLEMLQKIKAKIK